MININGFNTDVEGFVTLTNMSEFVDQLNVTDTLLSIDGVLLTAVKLVDGRYRVNVDYVPYDRFGWHRLINALTPELDNGYISLDNGVTFMTAADAIPEIEENDLWDIVFEMMDEDTRDGVHNYMSPCTNEEFLDAYLKSAPCNLVIG